MSQNIFNDPITSPGAVGLTGRSETDQGEFSGQSGNQAAEALDHAADTFDAAKERARSLANDAREQAVRYAGDGKDMLTGQVEQFAQVVRRVGDTMRDGSQAAPAEYVSQAADRLEDFSRVLRENSVEELLAMIQRFGARNRTAVFGGALLAGIALGRFAIASSQARSAAYRNAQTGGTGDFNRNQNFGADRYRTPMAGGRRVTSRSVGLGSI